MPAIIYRTPAAELHRVDVADGASVMRAAISHGIRGIIGECGGQLMCATCHVHVVSVDGELPPISEDEEEMLECTAAPRDDASRLGCQLTADTFTEITVQIPDRQV